jgi:glycosyltransferase involved in cell wall biosynthesis
MSKLKVLYVLHGHPSLSAGGSETYAYDLYETLRRSDDIEPILVARAGAETGPFPSSHPGALFTVADQSDPNQYFVLTNRDEFDFFYMTSQVTNFYTNAFSDFLLEHRPDVVHFQHTLFLGYELITLVRQVLPQVPIVYTLHEYIPICHRDGQMLRTFGDELCLHASPRRCHECFPSVKPQDFLLRKLFIQSQFANVDLFLSPSDFLVERFVDWGLSRERMLHLPLGCRREPEAPAEENGSPAPSFRRRGWPGVRKRPRTRLGFFGQLNHYKGVDILLEAMSILGEEEPSAHLWLHGANLERQPEEYQERFNALLEVTPGNVTFAGAYHHEDLPGLMAAIDWVVVPSRWWENSPLSVLESFLHRRPVICSGIGGMAEKVIDEVNGLHFRVNDPGDLARVLRRAVSSRGLWETLQRGIPPVPTMEAHARELSRIYVELLQRPQRETHHGTGSPLEAAGGTT